MEKTYRIGEFAKLAGVTIRTLRYYDKIELLTPSLHTEEGHRRYTRNDLLRLQQIVTLKWMGFSLDEISDIINSSTYDLHRSLNIQKQAVDAKIAELQAASQALDTALGMTEQAELDAETISDIIRWVTAPDSRDLMQRYYTDDVWAGIASRGMSYSAVEMKQFEQDWADLYAAFEAHVDQPVESEAVQQLAARMDNLIGLFTGGDAKTEAQLAKVVEHADELPVGQQFYGDAALQAFMQDALTVYHRKKNTGTI